MLGGAQAGTGNAVGALMGDIGFEWAEVSGRWRESMPPGRPVKFRGVCENYFEPGVDGGGKAARSGSVGVDAAGFSGGLFPVSRGVRRGLAALLDGHALGVCLLPAHAALVAQFGERGVVDVMGTMSYYTLVSMSLNVDQYPLPDGAQPELAPLERNVS